jgi:hypothetical protein
VGVNFKQVTPMKFSILLTFAFILIANAKHEKDDPFWQEYPTHFQISCNSDIHVLLTGKAVTPIADWSQLPFGDEILQVATFQSNNTINGINLPPISPLILRRFLHTNNFWALVNAF